MIKQKKSCGNCKFAIMQDYGYSNYTVEGTDLVCAKKQTASFDVTFNDDKKLYDTAKNCKKYKHGSPIYMDCDCTEVDSLNKEQKEIWDMVNQQGDRRAN